MDFTGVLDLKTQKENIKTEEKTIK